VDDDRAVRHRERVQRGVVDQRELELLRVHPLRHQAPADTIDVGLQLGVVDRLELLSDLGDFLGRGGHELGLLALESGGRHLSLLELDGAVVRPDALALEAHAGLELGRHRAFGEPDLVAVHEEPRVVDTVDDAFDGFLLERGVFTRIFRAIGLASSPRVSTSTSQPTRKSLAVMSLWLGRSIVVSGPMRTGWPSTTIEEAEASHRYPFSLSA